MSSTKVNTKGYKVRVSDIKNQVTPFFLMTMKKNYKSLTEAITYYNNFLISISIFYLFARVSTLILVTL